MKKLIVGNWKMHFNPTEASVLVHRLDEKIKENSKVGIVFCPPFIDLYPVSKDLNKAKFQLGSQNIHYLDEGPFTGEISPQMLTGMVDFAIIGHSERRQYAHEDDRTISKKVAAAVRNDIRPILCVGDNLSDREHGAAIKVVTGQVEAGLAHVTAEEVKDVVIAYEPVWAISKGDGHGQFAKPDEVSPIVKAIRETVSELFGKEAGESILVLYGGSANPDNVRAYLEIDGVDGLLVGGASLNYEEFSKMVEVAQDLAG